MCFLSLPFVRVFLAIFKPHTQLAEECRLKPAERKDWLRGFMFPHGKVGMSLVLSSSVQHRFQHWLWK